MKSINNIVELMYIYGEKIGIDKNSKLYPTIATKDILWSDGCNLYFDNNKYYYVAMERGRINKKIESDDEIELLYYIFNSITLSLASKYSSQHKVVNKDQRRVMFKKQLELLEKINLYYRQKREKNIKDILKEAPYNDK